MIMRWQVLLLLGAAGAYGCGDSGESAGQSPQAQAPAARPAAQTAAFDTATAFVHSEEGTVPLRVEVADRSDLRALGLMHRDTLPQDAGMIFLYDEMQSGSSGFWMYNTRISLDIAFLDGAGRIVAIRQMEPCRSLDAAVCSEQARNYNPGAPYYGALEVNRGWFAEHGVEVGDRVAVRGRIGG